MVVAVTTAVSRGLLDLKFFDNSGRWWLGARVALGVSGTPIDGNSAPEVKSDADLVEQWQKLHKEGKV